MHFLVSLWFSSLSHVQPLANNQNHLGCWRKPSSIILFVLMVMMCCPLTPLISHTNIEKVFLNLDICPYLHIMSLPLCCSTFPFTNAQVMILRYSGYGNKLTTHLSAQPHLIFSICLSVYRQQPLRQTQREFGFSPPVTRRTYLV